MIGGRDVIISTPRGTEALDLAVRAITRLWPQSVIEDAESGETFRRYGQIDFGGRREILVFRDPHVAQLWEQLGSDPSLDGTLIHLLVSDQALTVALDATPVPEIEAFVGALRRALTQDLFASTAGRKAA